MIDSARITNYSLNILELEENVLFWVLFPGEWGQQSLTY